MTDPYGEDYVKQINKKKFAIIGVGGYIAPKHLQAIKDNNGELVAALDVNDSVGILDQYFINANFFNYEKDFFSFLQNNSVDYVSVCSPNYLHKEHIEKSIFLGSNVICEKPLVLNASDLNCLIKLQKQYDKKIYSILQLRLHPSIIQLQQLVENSDKKHKVNLSYITPRGNWYAKSWKGCLEKSGGLLMNIGVHFFDILLFVFGKDIQFNINKNEKNKMRGTLELEKANVDWFLSIDPADSPDQKAYKKLHVDDKEINMNESFSNLHSSTYENILNGNGIDAENVAETLNLIYKIGQHCESKNI